MNTEVKNSVGSNILSKENISLTSEENTKLKQANIQGKNITINSKKDILIESGVSTLDSKRSSQSLNGEINLLTGQFNIGSGVTKDKSEERSHTNSQIYGENIAIKSKDLSVKGGNIEADKVNIEAKNLHIESMQDKANSNRDKILNALGHEFGHYSKEDDIDKSQDISNYTGDLLENRTKGMVAKEATEDTLAAIRNNKNVIIGEEGKKLAESIPEDRREYKGYIYERDLNLNYNMPVININVNVAKGNIAHSGVILIPDKQEDFFDEVGNLKEKYVKLGYPNPHKFPDGKLGWVEAGFRGEESKGELEGKLVIRFNPIEDLGVSDNLLGGNNKTHLTGRIVGELKLPKNVSDTQMIEKVIEKGIGYKKAKNYADYSALPQLYINLPRGNRFELTCGYNCHSMTGTLTHGFEPYKNKKNNLPLQRGREISHEDYNKFNYPPTIRFAPGLGNIIPDKHFKGVGE